MSESNRLVRLVLRYDGSAYCGWQVQPERLSVQQVVEKAFEKMTGINTRALAASRTDAGVHAWAQHVCMANTSRHDPEALMRGMNFHLPDDVVILSAQWADDGFNPRRDAVGKHYRYTIHNAPFRPVFDRHTCWHLRYKMDVGAMNRACAMLEGEHDFSSFRGAKCEANSPVRTIDAMWWIRSGDKLILNVYGRSFLKQMVRNLVGTLVDVGRGRWAPERVSAILEGKKRSLAGQTAPAKGLCLMKVFFDKDSYFAAVNDERNN